MASRFAIVLPARFQSTRFPGKPLASIAGKPLIEWVYRRAQRVRGADRVVVATDHPEIATVVEGFGGVVVMTSDQHLTGTDRVAEVARGLDCDTIVNLQGDEPVFPEGLVEEMVGVMENDVDTDIVTACHPIHDDVEMANPNAVKVVMDLSGQALYFSRSPIPRLPAKSSAVGGGESEAGKAPLGYRHIGVYVYRRTSLLRFAGLPPTPLEISEGLEQLRALENGMVIRVVETVQPTVGVDVPSDIKSVEKALGTE